jgi:hypothetical protein
VSMIEAPDAPVDDAAELLEPAQRPELVAA